MVDYQRAKLYHAEQILKSAPYHLPSPAATKEYLQMITSSPWWTTYQVTGEDLSGNVSMRPVRFHLNPHQVDIFFTPQKTRWAHALTDRVVMGSGQKAAWAWNTFVVIHELTHIAVGNGEHHGPVFARTLLDMVDHFLGKEESTTLRTSFDRWGVKWRIKQEHERFLRQRSVEQKKLLIALVPTAELVTSPALVPMAAKSAPTIRRVKSEIETGTWRQAGKSYQCECCDRTIQWGASYFDTNKRVERHGILDAKRWCYLCANSKGIR